MKPHKIISGLAALALGSCLALLPAVARAGEGAPRTLSASQVQVKIEGQSTLHGWEVSAGAATITATVVGGRGGLFKEISGGGLKGLDLKVAVDSLKSTEGGGMDKNMHKALESDKFPTISFSMKNYELKGLNVTAYGKLNIHGQAQAVTLTALLDAKDGVSAKGSYPLLMSGFGVKPPVMMFGTVRVADRVTILYSFKLND
ncbi:MAG TPA: YceI family protein [bacterium]|jgi:hypothetical protein|nr:YceI family protein [bacterium]